MPIITVGLDKVPVIIPNLADLLKVAFEREIQLIALRKFLRKTLLQKILKLQLIQMISPKRGKLSQ